jgi:acyl-homoserine lactone acylase PvdQ
MNAWIWGLRHQVRFESLLAPFLGNDPSFDLFTRPFAIDTAKLPLAPNLPQGDPRRDLRWFPRPGDQWGVDAANPGFSGTGFTHGNGPVFRMVFALKDGQVSGQNVIPGGQSGLTDSPFFSDQARLWLANEALPIRFTVDEVVAGASGREVYRPSILP